MFLLPIIHGTPRMSICHYNVERTYLPRKIHSMYHLSFLKKQRVNIFTSHLPFCPIHQIMRMLTNILIFMILVVVIYPLPHLIMMLIQLLSIYPRHCSTMIYLSMKSKPHTLSRHFSPSWWLCQALAILRLVSLPVRKLLKHSRLLITLFFALKINQTPRFHSSTQATRSHHSWVGGILHSKHMHNISGLPF